MDKTQEVTKVTSTKRRNIFSRTKLYLFEYSVMQVANIWIGTAISITVFSIFSIISGENISSSIIESLAWVFGLILIFFPISIILYARTTGEESTNKARLTQRFRKVIFYAMLSIATISAVSFLGTAVYTASRALFGIDDTSSLLSITLPSAIVLLFHIYFIVVILKREKTSARLRRLNVIVLSILGLTLAGLVLGIALQKSSGVSSDKKIVKDLGLVSSEIRKEFNDTGMLPDSISDLKNLQNDALKEKFIDGQYVYKPTPSNGGYNYDQPVTLKEDSDSTSSMIYPDIPPTSPGEYQLCATFNTRSNTYDNYDSYGPGYIDSAIRTEAEFEYHPKGYYCYSLYAY
ncbi:MAG: hypothetical protein QG623_76 [Patescibacteria group bacterium]|nr:hypothetical protein [Patescibacteria group bacterium]